MPDATDPNVTPIETEWLNFVASLQPLLDPQPGDRPLDQYLQFRNDVLALVQRQDFMLGLRNAWPKATDSSHRGLGELLLSELRAFPLAVEVARTQETAGSEEKGWIRRWLGRASIVTGSVKDILDNLPPVVAGGLTMFGELLELFKGN